MMGGFAGICPVKQLCQCPGGDGVRAPQSISSQIEELQSVCLRSELLPRGTWRKEPTGTSWKLRR